MRCMQNSSSATGRRSSWEQLRLSKTKVKPEVHLGLDLSCSFLLEAITFSDTNIDNDDHRFRVWPFKDAFSPNLFSLSAFLKCWHISTGKLPFRCAQYRERQGKGLPRYYSGDFKDKVRQKNILVFFFFLREAVVCMRILIVTRTSMELKER